MAYATHNTTVDTKGVASLNPRRSCSLILRGAHIFRGALAMEHNNRAMPAGAINLTKTVDEGGPYKVAGGSSDGDLFFIAKRGDVKLTIADGAALGIAVASTNNYVTITIVSGTTTANQVIAALEAHSRAYSLLGATAGGTGADHAGVASQSSVPFVRLLGVSMFEIDNTANDSADKPIPAEQSEFMYGRLYMLNDYGGTPVDGMSVPGKHYVQDDQTVTAGLPRLGLEIDVEELALSGRVAQQLAVHIAK